MKIARSYICLAVFHLSHINISTFSLFLENEVKVDTKLINHSQCM